MSSLQTVDPAVNEAPTEHQQPFNWRDHLRVHPACDVYPDLSRDELMALGHDIRTRGLQSPIVVWRKENPCEERYHDEFQLIDGRNRLDAMAAVGLKFKFERGNRRSDPFLHFLNSELCGWDGKRIKVEVKKIPEEEIETFVASANLHRRHLTAEEKRERIAKELKAQPATSNRQIAGIVKTDDKTVAKVRAKLESTAEIPQLKKTTGSAPGQD
jgi:ParB-like chromosome segregation protein Spo0J